VKKMCEPRRLTNLWASRLVTGIALPPLLLLLSPPPLIIIIIIIIIII
jgi:hypothetical protein